MSKFHLLLVEDELFLATVMKDSLEQRQYQVTHAVDGQQAYKLFIQEAFSLCIVDVMLPHIDGFTFVKRLRSLNTAVPVLFLTARTATQDLIEGYASGGNDYLKKPFSLDELFLRVDELLKRSSHLVPSSGSSLMIGQYEFIPHKQTLHWAGQEPIRLSHRETQLLQILYEHKNSVLDRRLALVSLWGDDSYFQARTMDVYITKLRKHLQQDSTIEILNLRGVGYKLIC